MIPQFPAFVYTRKGSEGGNPQKTPQWDPPVSLLAVGAVSLLRLTALVASVQAQDLVCQCVMLESCIQVKAPRVAESAVHMECIVKHSYVTFPLALGMPYWCRGQ